MLEDADRLLVLYMDCITECALHVYLSATSFPPANSAIHPTFKHQLFGKVTLNPQLVHHWSFLRINHSLPNPIYSLVFSQDGKFIATASATQGVQVWNVVTGRNVASLGDRPSTALLVRFSPSGALLAAAFEGGTVTVWDPKVGREHLKHENCHTGLILCLEFSKNSTLLASGSRDHAIQVWSMEGGQALYRLASHKGPVTSLQFSNDSLWLVSGSEDNLIIIWEMSTGKLVRRLMGHHERVNCVAVSKDGSTLASGSEDKTIKIWDTSSGKCTHTFHKGHHAGIQSVHFFDEDKYVHAASDETILAWDVASRRRNTSDTIWVAEQFFKMMLKRFPMWQVNLMGRGLPKPMMRLLLNHTYTEPTERQMTTAYAAQSPSFIFSNLGLLFVGSLPLPMDGLPLYSIEGQNSIAVSSDGRWAATADTLGSLRIFDLTMPRQTWDGLEAALRSNLIFHADLFVPSLNGTRFIVGNVMQWSLVDENYHIIKKIDMGMLASMHDDGDIRFKFSPDGGIFFCVVSGLIHDHKSTLRVFDSLTGEQHTQFKGLKEVHSFVASADGSWIACGHGSGQVDVFRIASKERTNLKDPDASPINVLLFSDDAQELIGGSQAGIVRVWDHASGTCKATFGCPPRRSPRLRTLTPPTERGSRSGEKTAHSVCGPPRRLHRTAFFAPIKPP